MTKLTDEFHVGAASVALFRPVMIMGLRGGPSDVVVRVPCGDTCVAPRGHTFEHHVAQAIYTMFEITFAGSWPLYARPVIEDIAVGSPSEFRVRWRRLRRFSHKCVISWRMVCFQLTLRCDTSGVRLVAYVPLK